MSDLSAVLVLFGTSAAAVAPLIRQLQAVAGQVIVVDNRSDAPPLPEGGEGVVWIANGNRGGLAGAYNRALAVLGPMQPDDLVVMVDEDSDAAVLPALLADTRVRGLLSRHDVAAVAPASRDRATGLRGRPMILHGRWRLSHAPRDFEDLREVSLVINSMTLWRRAALARIGTFDEFLGVDHIDTDMCLRARAAGLSVWMAGGYDFAHAVGQRRRWSFLGRQFQTGGHSPARRYGIGRATVILARRYGRRQPGFVLLALGRLIYEAAGILAAEDARRAKLAALVQGIAAGMAVRSVYLPSP